MPARNALLVVAHPRPDSLTARIADRARERLADDGFTVDVLDLHAEEFDPRMTTEDEPDWTDRDKTYSATTEAHMRRLAAADTIVVVFPVWWMGLPAILKGWIDRVWNYGFAYGRGRPRLHGKRILWFGLAGYSEDDFTSPGWDELLKRQLTEGISRFCGIDDATVHLLYGTVPNGTPAARHIAALLTTADADLTTLLTKSTT
ncbi:NAD(P)H oxidoreductase [Streptomyces litchfieldiae]|uniref:NAD(P)H oxidoreductase n=1 Tax=Streptomyces litchfieldiae TaxID=3075543 RepID=A0ABU2N0B9_9ACTN|nr:NAD(P)H oxidoreductase [Streptomyces sp. DSM 44938]MDT0347052.1 NAD(P)H oxidoreductase [Streptomyces sp. DSM 44938]